MLKRNTQDASTLDKELHAIKKCLKKKNPSTGKNTPSGNLVTNGQL